MKEILDFFKRLADNNNKQWNSCMAWSSLIHVCVVFR